MAHVTLEVCGFNFGSGKIRIDLKMIKRSMRLLTLEKPTWWHEKSKILGLGRISQYLLFVTICMEKTFLLQY
jgi:hypothetical protein